MKRKALLHIVQEITDTRTGFSLFVLMVILIAITIALAGQALPQGIIVRDVRTSDSTFRTTESSMFIPEKLLIPVTPQDLSWRDSVKNLRILLAELEVRQKKIEAEMANAHLDENVFGVVLSVSRVLSRYAARQHYALSLSYGVSPPLRIEGGLLAAPSGVEQGADLGGRLLIRYKITNSFDAVGGGVYRAAQPLGTLEDDKFVALVAGGRHYIGAFFVEGAVGYEYKLNWHVTPSKFTQKPHAAILLIGVGYAFEGK
jgi:hypothetical protein